MNTVFYWVGAATVSLATIALLAAASVVVTDRVIRACRVQRAFVEFAWKYTREKRVAGAPTKEKP